MKFLKTLFFFMAIILLGSCTDRKPQTKVIAHRGFWNTEGSAQNSLASLKKADSIGCYGSEFDVYFTIDNGFVVHHDQERDSVSMINDSLMKITALTIANGENIPTLDHYLQAAKELRNNTRLIFEIKPLDDAEREKQAIPLIIDKLRAYNLLEQTDFISFSKTVCTEIIRLLPDAKTYYLEGDLTPQELKDMNFTGLDYSMNDLRSHTSWIKEAQELGLETNVWTVNKEEDMRFFIEQGVDYITTNEPLLLQKILAE